MVTEKLGNGDFPLWVRLQAIDLRTAFDDAGIHGKLYIVGGTVRDALIGREPRDGDYATSADFRSMLSALNISDLFDVETSNPILMTLGTIHKPTDTRIDLAVLRAERYGDESLYPVEVTSPVPVEWDLARRDFTVNAMAYDIKDELLIDPYEGARDTENKLIRILHEDSFKDDPNRIIRAVELGGRLGFKLEKSTGKLAEECILSPSFDKLESAISKGELLALIKENTQ